MQTRMKHFGVSMQQHPDALPVLTEFFSVVHAEEPIKRIIEIGSGHGGLTTLLAVQALELCADVFSIDILEPKHRKVMEALGVKIVVGDFWKEARSIGSLIEHDGRSIVMCDGGDKKHEVVELHSHLKPTDLILAHDYAMTSDCQFSVWPHREILDSHLKGLPVIPERLRPGAHGVMERMRRVGWGVWRRT